MGIVIPAILIAACIFLYVVTRPRLSTGQKIVWTLVNVLSCFGIVLYLFTGAFTDRYDVKVLDPGFKKYKTSPTVSDTVYTVKPLQESTLPTALTEAIQNNGFRIRKEVTTKVVYRNCSENDYVLITGNGISMYRLTKGTFHDEDSDILLLQYTFSDKQKASDYSILLQHTLFKKEIPCNKKVQLLVSDGTVLYDFSSDSELVRVFIDQYTGLISSDNGLF